MSKFKKNKKPVNPDSGEFKFDAFILKISFQYVI